MSRGGRRRRVLNDEVRSASGLSLATYQAQHADFEAPRYAEQASVEHHPQVTDFVPRRGRAVLMTLAAGMALGPTDIKAAESLQTFQDAYIFRDA